uniref:Uncharacterized protein n=1 Tax=Magallana gigas TaxID=29159 RepID=A0A8W8I307_MAGGI|nr:uncharacterized protein LOC109619758 [Crassostrea gigas]
MSNSEAVAFSSGDSFHPSDASESDSSQEEDSVYSEFLRKRKPRTSTPSASKTSKQRRSRVLTPMTPASQELHVPETPTTSGTNLSLGQENRIIDYLRSIDRKIDCLSTEVKNLREEISSSKDCRRKEDPKPTIPPRIRTAVHDAYKHAIEDGSEEWVTKMADKKMKVSSDENKETTEAVRRFVKGLYPEVQDGVIQAAVGRYFDSISQKNHKESTGKVDRHKMKMLHYSRRKRKLQWRTSMISKKTGWDEEKKRRVRDAMDITYMSSEEEVNSDEDSFFTVKPLPWRSEEFSGIIAELDSKFEKTQSSRSRRQKIKRVKGNNPSERPKPTLRDGHEWVFV